MRRRAPFSFVSSLKNLLSGEVFRKFDSSLFQFRAHKYANSHACVNYARFSEFVFEDRGRD